MYIYVDLTNQFNEGRLRAILSSGQAVVLHRLAMMSKDGDWIVREDKDALANIEALETALDAERRRLMHANEHRLKLYALSAKNWAAIWNEVEMQIAGLSLLDAHTIIKEKASGILPFKPAEGNIHE